MMVVFSHSCNPPAFVLGFVGTGMVGTIATNELIDQLETKLIGYVLSEDLPTDHCIL